MTVKVTNNAFGTISAGISSTDTTVTLDTGQGARFPTLGSGEYFYGTLIDTSNNVEIIKVTARSTDSMTVTRAQDNTTARAFAIGDRFELRPIAKLFEDIQSDALIDNSVPDQSSHSGKFLTTDGTNVSWGLPDDAADLTTGTLDRGRLPAGSILQVVTTTDGTRRKFSIGSSNSTWLTNYSYLNTSFTPLSSSSKLMFFVCIHYGVDDATSGGSVFWRIKEGSTVHSVLNGDSSQTFPSFSQDRWNHGGSGQQYDTKRAIINGIQISNSSTTARTYSIEFRIQSASRDVSINRDGSDSSDTNQGNHSPTLTSNLTIVEVQT